MKKILLFGLLAISTLTFGQTLPTTKTRSDAAFTAVDQYLNVTKRLGIPTADTDNLDAVSTAPNTRKIIFNTTLGKLRIYNPAAGTWADATAVDLSTYYNKTETDYGFLQNIPNYNVKKQDAGIAITGEIYSEGNHYLNEGEIKFATGYISAKTGSNMLIHGTDYATPLRLKSFATLIEGSNGEQIASFDSYKRTRFYGDVTVDSNIINAKLIQPTADYLTVTQQAHLSATDALNLTVAGGSVYMDNYGLNAIQSVISGRSLIEYPNGVLEFIGADDSKTWKFKPFGDGKISFLTNYNGKGVYFNQNEITDADGVRFLKTGDALPSTGGTVSGDMTVNGTSNLNGNIIATANGNIFRYVHGADGMTFGGYISGNNFSAFNVSSTETGSHFKSYLAPTESEDIIRLTDLNGYVSTSANQNIAGYKTFTNTPSFNTNPDNDSWGVKIAGDYHIQFNNYANPSEEIARITNKINLQGVGGGTAFGISSGVKTVGLFAPSLEFGTPKDGIGGIQNFYGGKFNFYSNSDLLTDNTPVLEMGLQAAVEGVATNYFKVTSSDIEITDLTKGVILKSPDGTRWRITVSDAGVLTTTSL